MREKEINRITFELFSEQAKPDLDDVLRRIDDQTDDERSTGRSQALEVMPEHTSRGKWRRAAVGISAAAAVLALAFCGILLLPAVSPAKSADNAYEEVCEASEDKAESCEDVMDDSADAEISNSAEYDVSGTLPLVSESDGNDDENPENSPTHTSRPSGDVRYGYVECSIPVLEMMLSLPADSYLSGRAVDEDSPVSELFGLSAAQLEADYRKRGVYYNSVWFDGDADMTEIIVTMEESESSRNIFNLSRLDEYGISRIRNMYLDYSDRSASYYSADTVENSQVLFIRVLGTVSDGKIKENHLKYMTIVNGRQIEITLIERFGIEAPLAGDEPAQISQRHSEMMEQIIPTVRWERIRSGFLTKNRGVLFFSLIAVCSIITLTVYYISKKKKAAASDDKEIAVPVETAEKKSDELENKADEPEIKTLSSDILHLSEKEKEKERN